MDGRESELPEVKEAEEVLRVLDTPLARRLGDYLLIETDLKHAGVWFYLASDEEKRDGSSYWSFLVAK